MKTASVDTALRIGETSGRYHPPVDVVLSVAGSHVELWRVNTCRRGGIIPVFVVLSVAGNHVEL